MEVVRHDDQDSIYVVVDLAIICLDHRSIAEHIRDSLRFLPVDVGDSRDLDLVEYVFESRCVRTSHPSAADDADSCLAHAISEILRPYFWGNQGMVRTLTSRVGWPATSELLQEK